MTTSSGEVTRYEVRDWRNRREAVFPTIEEARAYFARHPRRIMEIVQRTYYGPKSSVGQRASTATTVDRRGM